MNKLRRLAMPYYVMALTSPTLASLRRRAAELTRLGGPHVVQYFHQVEDPYSHLAAQVLARLVDKYDIKLDVHLVGPPPDGAAPERERLEVYARRDAADVAPPYGLRFPAGASAPATWDVERATRLLAGAGEDFVRDAVRVGDALWAGTLDELDGLPAVSADAARAAVAAGNVLREQTGHYLGAMFSYGGEWFWGVDRLHYLEQRLRDRGLLRPGQVSTPIAQPPEPPKQVPNGEQRVVLEYFASLRSPYSCIAMNRVFGLADKLPVELVLRPVLPMVMRGLPVPKTKRLYILWDTKREADRLGSRSATPATPSAGPSSGRFHCFRGHASRAAAGSCSTRLHRRRSPRGSTPTKTLASSAWSRMLGCLGTPLSPTSTPTAGAPSWRRTAA